MKEEAVPTGRETFPPNAETINTLVDAMAALVFATVHALPADAKPKYAQALARLAKNAEAEGNTPLETLLIDLHRAASSAA